MQDSHTTHIVFLSLGTNLGDKMKNLRKAIQYIKNQIGIVMSQSDFYTSEPWGFSSENSFLNCALSVSTTLLPTELLDATQKIERMMGRHHKTINKQYTDRLIDIDILFYDALVIHTPTLTIPHPLLHQRQFVLEPMNQIAPDMVHPLLQQSIATLLATSSE